MRRQTFVGLKSFRPSLAHKCCWKCSCVLSHLLFLLSSLGSFSFSLKPILPVSNAVASSAASFTSASAVAPATPSAARLSASEQRCPPRPRPRISGETQRKPRRRRIRTPSEGASSQRRTPTAPTTRLLKCGVIIEITSYLTEKENCPSENRHNIIYLH